MGTVDGGVVFAIASAIGGVLLLLTGWAIITGKHDRYYERFSRQGISNASAGSGVAKRQNGPMTELPKLISKKTWLLVFNIVAVTCVVVSDSFHWDLISVVSYGIALVLINWVAWISARKYKGKCRGW
jgi:hypothetical protein